MYGAQHIGIQVKIMVLLASLLLPLAAHAKPKSSGVTVRHAQGLSIESKSFIARLNRKMPFIGVRGQKQGRLHLAAGGKNRSGNFWGGAGISGSS